MGGPHRSQCAAMSGWPFKGPPAPSRVGFRQPSPLSSRTGPCLRRRGSGWRGVGGLWPHTWGCGRGHPSTLTQGSFGCWGAAGACASVMTPRRELPVEPLGPPPVPRPAPWPRSSLPHCTPRAHQMGISLHAPEAIPKAGFQGHPPTTLSWGLGRELLSPQPPPCPARLPCGPGHSGTRGRWPLLSS